MLYRHGFCLRPGVPITIDLFCDSLSKDVYGVVC